MSNSACCDINKNCTLLKIHVMCRNQNNCQKQIFFTPKHYMLESAGFGETMRKILKGSQSAWTKCLKPALNKASPYIGMAVSAGTKNPQIGKAMSEILKSTSGGKILNLTDHHGNGLILKVI